jgi:uncharacterized protein DUF1774
MTLFWDGAVAVGSNDIGARLAANIFIWVIFVIGIGHIFLERDYLGGYALSLLTLCESHSLERSLSPRSELTWEIALAVKQFEIKVISLQWIFAFVIFAVFFLGSLYVSTVVYSERDIFFVKIVTLEEDREREPLLTGQESG